MFRIKKNLYKILFLLSMWLVIRSLKFFVYHKYNRKYNVILKMISLKETDNLIYFNAYNAFHISSSIAHLLISSIYFLDDKALGIFNDLRFNMRLDKHRINYLLFLGFL